MATKKSLHLGENAILMIDKMNRVGIGKIVKYARANHPRENVNRNIQIIRSVAKCGYADTAYKFNVSRQYAEIVLKRYYGYALELDAQNAS